jgi:hypothetical protein
MSPASTTNADTAAAGKLAEPTTFVPLARRICTPGSVTT